MDFRGRALQYLIDIGAYAAVRQLLQNEFEPQVKRKTEAALAASLHKIESNTATLRTAKDPAARRTAAIGLIYGGGESVDRALASAYSLDRDYEVKRTIIFALSMRKSFKLLAELGRDETDLELKRNIVRFLSESAYLSEMLK